MRVITEKGGIAYVKKGNERQNNKPWNYMQNKRVNYPLNQKT